MEDIEIAKKILHDENLSVVAVKNGNMIFKSAGRGIKPLYDLVKENMELISNASVADKVVGKGAALLYTLLNVKELYINLISEGGAEILNKNNILFTSDKICDYIMNNSKNDYCPIEKLSLDIKEAKELVKKLDEFFMK